MFACKKTPIGSLGIEIDGTHITKVFLNCTLPEKTPSHPLLVRAFQELDEYFAGKRETFDLPLSPAGTPFQRRVWDALCEIPYGEIVSYKAIAEAVECPKGFRAVGLANNRNPIAILIPCHRVVGTSGKLVGYAGGLEMKQKLLDLEAGVNALL